MQIDFAKIEGLDILLNMAYKSLLDNNKYDYILQILEYYIKNEIRFQDEFPFHKDGTAKMLSDFGHILHIDQ